MINFEALTRALPISALEPQWIALIDVPQADPEVVGWREGISLFEPPAAWRVPFVEPMDTLKKLWRYQGASALAADERARDGMLRLRASLEPRSWVQFFDELCADPPDYVPLPEMLTWLRTEGSVGKSPATDHLVEFLKNAADVAASTPLFVDHYDGHDSWSLKNLPDQPPPRSMCKFTPGSPWGEIDAWVDQHAEDNPFTRWRQTMRPIAQALHDALGKSVYHFSDPANEFDDDDVHRFLVLHWCCTWKPDSSFVRYLIRESGASGVAELQAALIDPANYSAPFVHTGAFGLEANACRMKYLKPGQRKTVGVVFASREARETSKWIVPQKIGADMLIVAPSNLTCDGWLSQVTHHCRSFSVQSLVDERIDDPLELLAEVDELCVIANATGSKRGEGQALSESLEDLLWIAQELGVKATLFYVDRTRLYDPKEWLQKRGVPSRIANRSIDLSMFKPHLRLKD